MRIQFGRKVKKVTETRTQHHAAIRLSGWEQIDLFYVDEAKYN